MKYETNGFPPDFLFGAATSGGQTEGNHNSNWEEFEIKNAKRLSKNPKDRDFGNGKLPKRVRDLLTTELSDPENYRSGNAIGWREGKYIEDLDIAVDLGLKAIRFSPERSFIEPQQGIFNPEAIQHYQKFIDECKKRGIEPIMTLFHFTEPLYITKQGGWQKKEMVKNFSNYSETLLQLLDKEIQYIITINEPEIYSYLGWIRGEFPPNKRNIYEFSKVRKNLIEANKLMYDRLKKIYPESKISAALNLMHTESKTNKPIDRLLAFTIDKIQKSLFAPQIIEHTDFISLNHYFHNVVSGSIFVGGNFSNSYIEKRSDLGWYLNPESIYHLLIYLHKQYNKPIFITENGLADKNDTYRSWYIKKTLEYVKKAMKEDVNVIGYLHWTLTDNFEWDKGKAARFGLVAVDSKTQERHIRDSAKIYSDIIKNKNI